MAGTLPPPEIGEKNSTGDPKYIAAIKRFNEMLDASNNLDGSNIVAASIPGSKLTAAAGITNAQLAAAAKPFTWYTPSIINTEESRTNTAFGTLTTPDEIKSVVLPANGLILVGYAAIFKSSVSVAGRAAIFLNSNQLKAKGSVQEVTSSGTAFQRINSLSGGLILGETEAAYATTGEAIGQSSVGGLCVVTAAAGTYDISVQFKSSSGSVTAKERKLWVATLGV